MARMDFDGDGRSDILWRHTDGTIGNWLGSSANTFANNSNNSLTPTPTNWRVVAVGDFNGDGRDDILWRDQTGKLGNWLANPNGSYTINNSFSATITPEWNVVGAGDFNGDGRDDILWQHNDGRLANWLGNANGSFTINDASITNAQAGSTVLAIGDFNGDNRDDIITRSANNTLTIGLGQANGTYSFQSSFGQVGSPWEIVGVGDFNGDNRDDLLWRNLQTGQVGNWLNTGGTGTSTFRVHNESLRTVALNWSVEGTGDYNGDGRDDILWRQTSTGEVGAWYATASGNYVISPTLISVPLAWQVQPNPTGINEWDY